MQSGRAPERNRAQDYVGRFAPSDGTLDFYLRVSSLIDPQHHVLDFGAGRAGWMDHPVSDFKRSVRSLVGKAERVVAADVDSAVLDNGDSHEQILLENGRYPGNDTFDLIVSDFVLEHIEDPAGFAAEIDRLLRPGGWFCARTPHRYCYVAIASRIIPDSAGDRLVAAAQRTRKSIDVCPKVYRMDQPTHQRASSIRPNQAIRSEVPWWRGGCVFSTPSHPPPFPATCLCS